MRIDKAVNETRKAVIAAGESVSSTRVSRSVLEELQADSWRTLGVQMQDVPSLRQLMALEGKVKALQQQVCCFFTSDEKGKGLAFYVRFSMSCRLMHLFIAMLGLEES